MKNSRQGVETAAGKQLTAHEKSFEEKVNSPPANNISPFLFPFLFRFALFAVGAFSRGNKKEVKDREKIVGKRKRGVIEENAWRYNIYSLRAGLHSFFFIPFFVFYSRARAKRKE